MEDQTEEKIADLIPESLGIFILPPSEDALCNRLRLRGRDREEDIDMRISEARSEISLAKSSGVYDHFVVNYDLEMTISEILVWIRLEMFSTAN